MVNQVAVTATAKEFAGIYRNKQYHEPDFSAVLDRALAAKVKKVMLTGMSPSDAQFNADIARARPDQCSITVGVHPYHASEPYANGSDGDGYFASMAQTIADLQSENPKLVSAFGELGLDYDHLEWASKDVQIQCFKGQLDLFVEEKYDLPLFLHCRAAFEDFVAVLEPYLPQLPRRGLVHSFVGSSGQMTKLTDMGFDVSVNGFSFKDRESLEMVAAVPLERLQLETDAPWGTIQPSSEVAKRYLVNAPPLPASKKRDKFQMGMMVKERNESCAISQIAFIVAGVRGLSVDEVAQAAWHNSTKMFRLEG
jgi:TatD DNase family protein